MRNLTFFLWADTHFGYDLRFGATDLRRRIIQQLNQLPGWPYPGTVGGVVETPEFVLLCGDAVDGQAGQGKEELALFQHATGHLRFPQVEVLGNHDTDDAYLAYFTQAYGGPSHSFDQQGVRFICLHAQYDPGERASLGPAELAFLETELAACGCDRPLILFVHSRLDRTTQGDQALDLLQDHRVLLIASAHIHKPAVFQLRGIDCLDVGQCRDHPIDPACGRVVYVCHLTHTRLTAVPWRWDLQDWERGQRWADPAAVARRLTLDRAL